MQTFSCRCGNPLFFENTHCLACESEVGWCPACCNIVALEPLDSGGYRCTHENCGTALMKCHNYAVENVCNRMVVMADGHADTLCDCCRYNDVIPDLSTPVTASAGRRWKRPNGGSSIPWICLSCPTVPKGKISVCR